MFSLCSLFLVYLFIPGILVLLIMKVNRLAPEVRADGKTIIITGGNRGIGRTTAIELARRGASLILACRNVEAGNKVAEEIKSEIGNSSVTVLSLDLSSFQSIKSFADTINEKQEKVDVLINNAGIYGVGERKVTADGNELHFQSNHLGPFLLTRLLVPKLKASPPARIVNVSSEAHRLSRSIDLDDVNFEKNYSPYTCYCVTKLMNIYFTNYLAGELKDSGVTVNSLHPGSIETDLLYNSAFYKYLYRWMGPLKRLVLRTEEEGAQTSVYCALEPTLEKVTGKYFNNCRENRTSGLAEDLSNSKKLWDISEKMTANYLESVNDASTDNN